jgi:hypothetical protein
MRTIVGILGMVVLVFTTGCQSSYQTLSDKTILLRAPKRGLLVPYHVLRTNALSADQMIYVQVGGQVRHPGTFELPQGATLLEAIAQAGGFTELAFPRRLLVTQRDGRKFMPKLHQVNDPRTWQSFAWFGETSDWLLEDGTKVEVPIGVPWTW